MAADQLVKGFSQAAREAFNCSKVEAVQRAIKLHMENRHHRDQQVADTAEYCLAVAISLKNIIAAHGEA